VSGPGEFDPSTLAVHLGRPPAEPGAALSPPVVLSSTYRASADVSPYGRDTNATWEAFEAVLGGLEGGSALAFASGMAAIAAVVDALPLGSWVVIPEDAYQGTRILLADLASDGRVALRTVDLADTEHVLVTCAEVADAPRRRGPEGEGGFGSGGLLWIESPTNPLLGVADIPALAEGAHREGLSVAADNTFATPLLQRPLDMGVDIVVHSVTKLLAGHSDVVMGAAVSRDPDTFARLARYRSLHGAVPGPFETLLAIRGIRTLAVRLERSQATAGELARRLGAHPGVSAVRYPGLAGDPGHHRAGRLMHGSGTIVSFDLAGGATAADAVCAAVRLIAPGTSLGGVESLVERRGRYPAESHLPPGLLRLSVGLEHVDDLWEDLTQALRAAAG
jgi:cystathionine gamma-synthase